MATQASVIIPRRISFPWYCRLRPETATSVTIFGTDYPTADGTCIRDYIHVGDLAQAHILALNALAERTPLIYNLGTGHGFSVREVIDSARRVTGRRIDVREASRREGDAAVLVASSARIRSELGWTPQHPDLDSIMASAWQWVQRRPSGYSTHPDVRPPPLLVS